MSSGQWIVRSPLPVTIHYPLSTSMSVPCSICQREFDPDASPAMPFCSERCRLVDLGRWLVEGYGMPIEREGEADGSEPQMNTDEHG